MKRLLIIMFLLVALGIASADIIKFETDLNFDWTNIELWYFDIYGGTHSYLTVVVNQNDYNSATKELVVDNDAICKVKVKGLTLIDRFPGEIFESGIDMRNYSYYVIERYFDMLPGDPGTPINQ